MSVILVYHKSSYGVKNLKITVLAENTSQSNEIGCEHGLSLYIETKKHNILFDTGQTELFSINAEKLNVNLIDVDIAVLSHGHYDHGGGLKRFLEINKNAPVYINKNAFGAYFNGTDKYIGLNNDLKNSDRLIFTKDTTEIDDELSLYTCNDKPKLYDLGSFCLNKLVDGKYIPDDFLHEQYLLINDGDKKVLISGCSHKGILNIVNWFDVDVIIGGFHFSKLLLDEKLKEYAEYLSDFKTEFYTCHCTGSEQYEFMKQYMDNLDYLSTGKTLII